MTVDCVGHPFVRLRVFEKSTGFDKQPPVICTEYFVAEDLKLWPNQKVISYFFDHGDDTSDFYRKEAFVITAMKEYEKYANVTFVAAEIPSSVAMRIAFPKSGGTHWTAIGTDTLMVNLEEPTMNLPGMDLNLTDAANFMIALHAIGHVLGLNHEDQDPAQDSIMKYSTTDAVKDVSEPHLANYDKAWLTLNYPKAPVNKDGGPVDIWTLRRSLPVLNVDDEYSSKILESDDLTERRMLYSQFVGAVQGSLSADTVKQILDEAKSKSGNCPMVIAGSQEGIMIQPQQQVAPKVVVPMLPDAPPHLFETVQSILDLLRILELSDRFAPLTQTSSKANSDRYDFVLGTPSLQQDVDSKEHTEQLPEAPLTREELNDLLVYLPDLLDYDPNHALPSSVQHGLFTQLKDLFDLNPTTIINLIPLVRQLLGLVGSFKKSVDVRHLTPSVTDTIVRMLENSRPENIFQEVHTLCFASTLAHDTIGKQEDLQAWLQKCLQCVLPEIRNPRENDQGWTLAWGPVAWKAQPDDDSDGPDLVWYVSHKKVKLEDDSTPRPTYVIAIAGTQMKSLHTWFKSNIDVFSVIDFEGWLSNLRSDPRLTPSVDVQSDKPYIARGTAHTVWRLLTVQAPGAATGEGTLRDFLESRRSDPGFRLIITGHSLGGALSPTLALVLNEAKIVRADCVLTYFIAGPSPGNDAFARLFANTFQAIPTDAEERKKRKYQVWNLNLVNERDPVPQAWCSNERTYPGQNLSNVHKQFPEYLMHLVQRAVKVMLQVLRDNKLDYAPLQSQIFRAPTSLEGVLSQHSEAYHDYVGIVPPSLSTALGR